MQAITCKYIPATNTKCSRVKATSESGCSVIVSYNDEGSIDPYAFAAMALCNKYNWHGRLAQGGTKNGAVFVFINDDETITV